MPTLPRPTSNLRPACMMAKQRAATACFLLVAVLLPLRSASRPSTVVGDVRVEALSSRLLRIEPKGPMGFEDRTTFLVAEDRSQFEQLPLAKTETPAGTLLISSSYSVLLQPKAPPPSCANPLVVMTVPTLANMIESLPYGTRVADRAACCDICDSDPTCTAWLYAPQFSSPLTPWLNSNLMAQRLSGVNPMIAARDYFNATGSPLPNCMPLTSFREFHGTADPTATGLEFGCATRGGLGGQGVCSRAPKFVVSGADGDVLYTSWEDTNLDPNMLHWPGPYSSKSYAVVDFPRFFVPAWGAAMIPEGVVVDPELVSTNGYDFRNNVAGDTYVFLLGDSFEDWQAARADFLRLTGPVPLLPDYAYGTWFTYWTNFSQATAQASVEEWNKQKLPIDVWALDMNWRNISENQDHYYDHPNTLLFDEYTVWFDWLKSQGLRTYFNDHPFPVAARDAGGLQTSFQEVSFRWQGLTEWLKRGLTTWWFDHNWEFSIPPPFVNKTVGALSWLGLDNVVWGSHVYNSVVDFFNKNTRDQAADTWYGGRTMTLTKYASPDWIDPLLDPAWFAEHPAHHRYPVWWSGDGVPIRGSVRSMVDSGMHSFKPFVHSDCGGWGMSKPSNTAAGDLLRWAAHCAFGTIVRFHDGWPFLPHYPWVFGAHALATIRHYLQARYRLMPSIIGAGYRAHRTGFPIVARGDFYWPQYKESATSDQYIFLDDILVAPIWDSSENFTQRSVWIPPGKWLDVWDNSLVTGPKTIVVGQPYERMPMWLRWDGGLLVTTASDALRVDDQDWSQLTVDAFPGKDLKQKSRTLLERSLVNEQVTTELSFSAKVSANFASQEQTYELQIQPGESTPERSWKVRFHLPEGEELSSLSLDGKTVGGEKLTILQSAAPAAQVYGIKGWEQMTGTQYPVVELVIPQTKQKSTVAIAVAPRALRLI